MFDLTTLDYIYMGVLLVSTIWASIRGGVYETVATVSWIVAALAARFISPWLDGVLQGWFKLTESTIGTLVTSYFVVFFLIIVIFGLFNQKLRDRIQDSMLKVTDHSFGILFGIIRGIAVMGLVYWVLLWYYYDTKMPAYVENARIRPVMQLTIKKIHDWFIPGESKLIQQDMLTEAEAQKLYDNLINPAVEKKSEKVSVKTEEKPEPKEVVKQQPKSEEIVLDKPVEVGYKESERQALDNQLMQIDSKQ